MPCPNTEVMVRTAEGDEKKPKCDNQNFDPNSGLGIPERVGGELTFVCDNCGLPKARRERDRCLPELQRFEAGFHSVDFSDLRKQIERADEKLRAYQQVHGEEKHTHLRGRFVDAVAQAHAVFRRMAYQLPEAAITQLTDQASVKLEEVGQIQADNPNAQAKLDKHRHDALRAISKAREDLESSKQPGIRRPQRLKLLRNGCGNAKIGMYKTLAYESRQEADVDEGAIGAEAVALMTSSEGEEAEHKYSKGELLGMRKPALIVLGEAEFNLTLKDSQTKDDLADQILEAQEKAKAPAVA